MLSKMPKYVNYIMVGNISKLHILWACRDRCITEMIVTYDENEGSRTK